jgi:hypothetical protein
VRIHSAKGTKVFSRVSASIRPFVTCFTCEIAIPQFFSFVAIYSHVALGGSSRITHFTVAPGVGLYVKYSVLVICKNFVTAAWS